MELRDKDYNFLKQLLIIYIIYLCAIFYLWVLYVYKRLIRNVTVTASQRKRATYSIR